MCLPYQSELIGDDLLDYFWDSPPAYPTTGRLLLSVPFNTSQDKANGMGGYVKVFQTVMESQMEAKFGNSISMSSNGLVLAVGALHYTGSSEEQGMVKVFHFQENNWASYMKIFLCEL